jgi:hypothetical protein
VCGRTILLHQVAQWRQQWQHRCDNNLLTSPSFVLYRHHTMATTNNEVTHCTRAHNIILLRCAIYYHITSWWQPQRAVTTTCCQ